MATGPSSPRQLSPQCASSIRLNNSSSKPPLKTYSKRALQDPSDPPSKRQRIEPTTRFVEKTTKTGVPAYTPTLPKKRSISEYFKPVAHARTCSSPQSSIFSFDPVQKNVESPPSSPLSPHIISPSVALRRTRTRRRLCARPPLGVIKMSDINAGSSKEHRKGKGKRIGMHDSFLAVAYPNFLLTHCRGQGSVLPWIACAYPVPNKDVPAWSQTGG